MKIRFTYLLLVLLGFASCKTRQNNGQQNPSSSHSDTELEALLIEATTEKLLKNYDKAEALFLSIVKVEPEAAVAYFELSEIYQVRQDANASLEYAKKAVELSPDNEWYLANLASVYFRTNQFEEASKAYNELLEIDPNNTTYIFNLAEVYLYQGKLEESLPLYNRIEEQMGLSEELIMHKNKIHLQLGQPDSAIAEMNKLIESNPTEPRYYGILADLYEEMGEGQKALETYQKILTIDPMNGYVHLSLYEYYKYHGQKDKSKEELRLAFESPQVDVYTKSEILSEYFINSERNEDLKAFAYELLDVCISVHPEEGIGYIIYADYLNRDAEYDKAISMMEKALQFEAADYSLHYQFMVALTSNNNFVKLDSASENAMELFPNQPAFYYFNGIANIQTKNYERAIEVLDLGKDLVFDNNQLKGDFFQYLGDACNGAKQYEQSDYYYDQALSLNPNNVYVLNNYAYYLSLRKAKLDKAAEMSKKANELYPNNATYMDTYGWVLYQQGKYLDAELWLQKALDNGGRSSGEVLEHYGDALFQLNKKEEALEYWIQAKEKGGASALIDQKIEEKELIEE
ncbi:tetratricopeptide repeat protein [Parvicella tangerina]|uniref:Beta-barrel assembly-enhancing protease n=1 Tax=Parvicella tangerina TaxID=2829795 RepID=A0A916JJ25_9FLAO|nr:tetratricopeptide repeat protein [Parvicella tangerina]CAG5076408.1 Beta-barrel assembly-enhancing protease [Parvicella tangerina]